MNHPNLLPPSSPFHIRDNIPSPSIFAELFGDSLLRLCKDVYEPEFHQYIKLPPLPFTIETFQPYILLDPDAPAPEVSACHYNGTGRAKGEWFTLKWDRATNYRKDVMAGPRTTWRIGEGDRQFRPFNGMQRFSDRGFESKFFIIPDAPAYKIRLTLCEGRSSPIKSEYAPSKIAFEIAYSFPTSAQSVSTMHFFVDLCLYPSKDSLLANPAPSPLIDYDRQLSLNRQFQIPSLEFDLNRHQPDMHSLLNNLEILEKTFIQLSEYLYPHQDGSSLCVLDRSYNLNSRNVRFVGRETRHQPGQVSSRTVIVLPAMKVLGIQVEPQVQTLFDRSHFLAVSQYLALPPPFVQEVVPGPQYTKLFSPVDHLHFEPKESTTMNYFRNAEFSFSTQCLSKLGVVYQVDLQYDPVSSDCLLSSSPYNLVYEAQCHYATQFGVKTDHYRLHLILADHDVPPSRTQYLLPRSRQGNEISPSVLHTFTGTL
ncbi:hypothetical protein JCM5350_007252 [Sporobolomyces pararoseus]